MFRQLSAGLMRFCMRVRLVTIFVLTTFFSLAVLAGDPTDGRSVKGSDKPTAPRKGSLTRYFGKRVDPQNIVPIGGSVKTPFGVGISNATINLMDMDGNIQFTTSASFGYFVLPNVIAGEMYVLSVRHPRYIFAFPAQVIEVNKPNMDFEFVGERNF